MEINKIDVKARSRVIVFLIILVLIFASLFVTTSVYIIRCKKDTKAGEADENKDTSVYTQQTQDNNTNTTENNTKATEGYTQAELEKMALDYYEAKTGYRPSSVASQVNADGTVAIQLYDNLEDHISTSDWYTVDSKTAVGTNTLGESIDLKVTPAKN